MIKINNERVNPLNHNYFFRKIYLNNYTIQALINFDNNIYIIIYNNIDINNNKYYAYKLLLYHIAITYRNTFYKLSKFIPLNNKNLFPSIFTNIFFIPFLNNFEKKFKIISKKIDLVLFGNSEYISSIIFDLDNKDIIYDTGYLVQKNYNTNFINFSKQKKIIDEIHYYGQILKNNYIKSIDKNIDKKEGCIKLELRATFPKPLFIIRFYPILKGVLIIHIFNQYKLSKIQVANPELNSEYIYERYKEIDAIFFDFFGKFEDYNIKNIFILEKFFFEYYLILGSNIKDIGRSNNGINKHLMTYKTKDFDIIYLNRYILQLIKDCINKYHFDNNTNNIINKIKEKLEEEYNKITNKKINGDININTNSSEDNYYKDLEFNHIDFIKEFKNDNINTHRIINPNDIKIQILDDCSNVNEYSKLNISKDNLDLIKRTIITSATRENLISKTNTKTYSNINNEQFNIYGNYNMITKQTEEKEKKEEKEDIPLDTDEPFKIDMTSIINNNIEVSQSKDISEFKSILNVKNKKY